MPTNSSDFSGWRRAAVTGGVHPGPPLLNEPTENLAPPAPHQPKPADFFINEFLQQIYLILV